MQPERHLMVLKFWDKPLVLTGVSLKDQRSMQLAIYVIYVFLIIFLF